MAVLCRGGGRFFGVDLESHCASKDDRRFSGVNDSSQRKVRLARLVALFYNVPYSENMTLIERAVLGKQGRVVVPAEIRKALNLHPGTTLTFSMRDGEAVISTPMTAARKLQEMFASAPRTPGLLASDELIAARRAEARRELED